MELLVTKLRKGKGWSKAELARRANLNASTISVIENGRTAPYDAQLKKLAKALRHPIGKRLQLVEGTSDEARATDDDA